MYGVPQPGTYGQYGFGAYPASPGGAAAGMPQAAAGAAAGQTAPGADVGAVGQAAQAHPSSYYSNYWGGKCSASTFFSCSLELTEIGASL
jgi:nucleolysin TIA-1/TIAR